LRKRNKINSRKYGTKGELTEQLALVLKALWTCKDPSDYSTTFKEVVERYGSQFRSSTQHDAQEFLLWLLDKVHEDLNTATKRKYKTIKNNYGRPDAVIAAETLANYMRCNNSFVQAVFRAQFRSSLTCPRCEKQSNTFDPFHCISVQLPQLTQQTVNVDVVYDVKSPKQVRMSLNIPQGSSVLALREQLHTDTKIDMKRMILTECSSSGFGRLFCDSHPLSNIEKDDRVMCIELPEKMEDSQVAICFVNVHRSEEKSNRFGSLFCMKLNRDVSFAELQKALLKQMSNVLKPETFSYSTPLNEMFKIHLQEPSADPNTYLESKFEHPLMTEMIDLALSVHPSDSGPAHIKLCLEWTEPEKFFSDMKENFVEDESISKNKEAAVENSTLTLQQCLDHYTKAETLSAEDAWRCPHCREYLPVVKTLGLWSLPDILVIHFKRFRQQQLKGSQASKLTTTVTFPLNELDMLPWYLSNNSNPNSSTSSSFGSLSRKTNSLRPSSKSGTLTKSIIPDDHRYDLYAICYHQGDTLETGHYTAACKNPYDQQWYKFDDQRVTLIKNENVPDAIVNNEAYMLFYQRRKASDCESSCASTSSSEHWVSRIPIPSSSNNTSIKSEEKIETKIAEEVSVKEEAKVEVVVSVETAPEPEKKDLTSVLADIDDIKPIDSDDIPEVVEETPPIIEKAPAIAEEIIVEHSSEVPKEEIIIVNGYHHEEKEIEEPKAEEDDDDKVIEKKIEVKVEISACSPPPELASEIDDVVHNDLLRREKKNSKSQDFMSHKINNLLWGDQNNNNSNRHSDLGGITISDLLLMDRIEDISSTSLPKNYMLHDTERISSRIRSVSSCSKDTLLYIDQQSLLDDESLLDNRSHWVNF
jgi:ubiquitin carboxyl-terminal hydrolase 31